MLENIGIALLFWNLIVFLLYGIDKSRSRSKKQRISENTLITTSFLMGGAGALAGMRIFHHKTKHKKFIFLIPLALILNSVTILIFITVL